MYIIFICIYIYMYMYMHVLFFCVFSAIFSWRSAANFDLRRSKVFLFLLGWRLQTFTFLTVLMVLSLILKPQLNAHVQDSVRTCVLQQHSSGGSSSNLLPVRLSSLSLFPTLPLPEYKTANIPPPSASPSEGGVRTPQSAAKVQATADSAAAAAPDNTAQEQGETNKTEQLLQVSAETPEAKRNDGETQDEQTTQHSNQPVDVTRQQDQQQQQQQPAADAASPTAAVSPAATAPPAETDSSAAAAPVAAVPSAATASAAAVPATAADLPVAAPAAPAADEGAEGPSAATAGAAEGREDASSNAAATQQQESAAVAAAQQETAAATATAAEGSTPSEAATAAAPASAPAATPAATPEAAAPPPAADEESIETAKQHQQQLAVEAAQAAAVRETDFAVVIMLVSASVALLFDLYLMYACWSFKVWMERGYEAVVLAGSSLGVYVHRK